MHEVGWGALYGMTATRRMMDLPRRSCPLATQVLAEMLPAMAGAPGKGVPLYVRAGIAGRPAWPACGCHVARRAADTCDHRTDDSTRGQLGQLSALAADQVLDG